MRHSDKKVKSVEELIQRLSQDRPPLETVWFRGQVNSSWNLVPSLIRQKDGLARESMLIKRFKQYALTFLDHRPLDDWEWLFIMQHHGVPTRLLDWSENPLAALYFSCTLSTNNNGSLWCLLPVNLNAEANIRPEAENDIPGFGHDNVLEPYSPSAMESERTTHNKPVAAIASRNTARMQAQSGVFTIFHRDLTPIEEIGRAQHVWRYVIPRGQKDNILSQLHQINVNRLTLFPELQSIGDHIREMAF